MEQQIRANLAQLGGTLDTPSEKLPSYLSAVAARDTAAYNLAHATIKAARDGRVGNVTVRPGEYVNPGQALFPEIVGSDTWIEANVRETDLNYAREGQPATFTVDAYPGHVYHAKVESFSPATGSELSVLPAENATGNWVKIVQRLPLRLTPELQPGDPPRRAGLSVNVEIDTGAYHNMPALPQPDARTGRAANHAMTAIDIGRPAVAAGPNKTMITITMMVAVIMQVLDTTIANVALPHMQGSLGATQDQIAWVLTSYIVAAAIMTPATGWLAGRIGRTRLFALSLTGFTACFPCSVRPRRLTLGQMVLFRTFQGLFGAALIPISQAVMIDTYSREEHGPRDRVSGAWAIMIGPITGARSSSGYLTDAY